MDIYIALVHHPVRNQRGERVTTSVTNLDIHDLSRSARTYSARGYYIVTPIEQQRSLVSRIVAHWRHGEGRSHNPVRAEAFETVRVARDIEQVQIDIEGETGHRPLVVATGAAFEAGTTSYDALRQRLKEAEGACLVLFGTGWGLADEVIAGAELCLPGIRAADRRIDYNHLSVRSAAAIILDRLLGAR